jgi:hypothetical protein
VESYDESGLLDFPTLQHGYNASHGLHAGVFFMSKKYQLGCASGDAGFALWKDIHRTYGMATLPKE